MYFQLQASQEGTNELGLFNFLQKSLEKVDEHFCPI
jgi:hypothetical protein